ncbi:BgTH12-07119 [Blumeria graminis f. sp. triticale]|uniref:BgtA-20044 n=3 Tax=Blumeria graminis TaxID=34373 RepID=A0A9X9MP37_BLUGR|nr:hypothetical protein BGT96224_A20044 [Blumeria graminis f. sp. tritici 96224]CAD6506190.1 BgTH12-07119 [Blumeria graminis f. sp. triticale]VDB94910.1 BgtA-20044 [Blumeria graminis f. sp. tritici]
MTSSILVESPMGPLGGGKGIGLQPTAMVSDMISLYRPAKHFRREPGHHGPRVPATTPTTIQSLDFDNEGSLLLTSESDSSMQIYNVREGKHSKTLLSQKYGVGHAMFAHASGCIIHSSTKLNNTIRYLSTHDNSYLRYFEGHEKNVTCLALHPGQDNFISCSEDNTLRVWEAGSKNCCGKLKLNGAYLAAWDPSGNVFAVASPTAHTILLYDFRNFDKEPFASFDMLPHYTPEITKNISKSWNSLEFSNDGKSLLLSTNGKSHFLLDAFDGTLKASLRRERSGVARLGAGDKNPEGLDPQAASYLYPSTGDACFTPDGRYVLSGSRQHNILIWDTMAPYLEKYMTPTHELVYKGDTAVIAFNPRLHFFATADKEVVFWVPDQSLA